MQEDTFSTTESTPISEPSSAVSQDDILHELADTLDHILHDSVPAPEPVPAEAAEGAEQTSAESSETAEQAFSEPVEQTPVEQAEPIELAEPIEQAFTETAESTEETQEDLVQPAEQTPAETAEQTPYEPVVAPEDTSAEPAEQAPVEQTEPIEQTPAEQTELIEQIPAEPIEQTPDEPAAASDETQEPYIEAQAPYAEPQAPERGVAYAQTSAGAVKEWDPFEDQSAAEAAQGAEEAPAAAKKKVRPGAVVLDIVLAIILVIVVLIIAFCVCFEGVYIVGTSMNPTFTGAIDADTEGGDYVYANKYRKPTYGDVVIVQETEEKIIIKRVIAMEGDTVKMEKGTVYVQYAGTSEYTELAEDYVAAENCTPSLSINTQKAHTVSEGCIYCLGDNRDVSNDSRQNGDFSLDSVLGVVPNWIISIKSFTTSLYNLIHF